MFLKHAFKRLKIFFEIIGLFYNTIQTVSYVGASIVTAGGIIAFTQNIPTYIPIIILMLGSTWIIFSGYQSYVRYRIWKQIQNIPELEDVLNKALEIHNHIKELSNQVIDENRKKNIKTKTRTELANKYFETLNISINDLKGNINPDGTLSKNLYKKIRKRQHLRDGQYFTIIPLLKGYSKLLNKSKLGIKSLIDSSEKYQILSNEYLTLQVKLNIPDKLINEINSLPELSYGLYSTYVGINLPNDNRSWIKDVPDEILAQQEDSEAIVNKAYMRAVMWLKNKVRMTIFIDSLK